MEFDISWCIEGHVVLVKSPAQYSEADIEWLDQQLLTYLDQANSHLVHIIYDETNAEKTPNIKAWTRMKSPKHPRYGWVVDVGMTGNVGFVYTLVSKILRTRHRHVESVDEAIQFLYSVDTSLGDVNV